MDIVDLMLQYRKTGEPQLLITSDLEINKDNLNTIVIEILGWLKLENKRNMWILQGKKTCFKPLKMNMQYPWCIDLYTLVEKEKLFHENFSIKNNDFDFSEFISEEDKTVLREKAYKNYNPQKHT